MAIFFRKLKTTPTNLLIARTDRIGDFILTLPVFETLKANFAINITVLVQELVAPLLTNNPHIDQILFADPKGSIEQQAQKIVDQNFDALLVLVNDPFMIQLLPFLKKIPARIGPLSKPKVFLQYNYPVLQKRSKSIQNEAEYNLELLQIFGIPPSQVRPKIYSTEQEIQQVKEKLAIQGLSIEQLQQSVVIHQGMNGSALNWPEEHYQRLMEQLLEAKYSIILSGFAPSELKQNEDVQKQFQERFPSQIFCLDGSLNLREYSLLLTQTRFFVGPSTGPTHVANAAGVPLFTFYPPIQVQSKTRWQPFLSEGEVFTPQVNCGQKFRCLGEKCPHYYCMGKIDPQTVFHSIQKQSKP